MAKAVQQEVTRELFEAADRELEEAKTADDVRKIMKTYYQRLGYRRLCRLFIFDYGVDELWLAEVERMKKVDKRDG